MQITAATFIMVCPLVFLAGLVDSIAGGGGLISLPAYLFAGIPIHNTVGTNKFSSSCGAVVAVFRFARRGLIRWRIAAPAVVTGMLGSGIGAHLSLLLNEKTLLWMLLGVLPLVALAVFNKHLLTDSTPKTDIFTLRQYAGVTISSFLVGIYDGMYGPGTGTFLIILLTAAARLPIAEANALAKTINMVTNLTAMVIFLLNGQVLLLLGITAALFNMAGQYVGSGMVMTKGSRVIRPIMLTVLLLLFVKILTELLGG